MDQKIQNILIQHIWNENIPDQKQQIDPIVIAYIHNMIQ